MTVLTKTTTDYWLLQNARSIIGNIARDSLVTFSVNKLRELKMVTSNFKNGFLFADHYYSATELKRDFFDLLLHISCVYTMLLH